MTAWKRAVAQAFDRADGYEDAARIQAIVAERLAATVAGEPLVPSPRILEIGCGTGLLTRALRARIEQSEFIATDIAPTMLARCRAGLGPSGGVRFTVMDGERPALLPGFDLIASSLAAQWFVDLEGALAGLAALLRPGGLMAVATLADGTFREWRAARARPDHDGVMPRYPSIASLRGIRVPGCATEVRLDALQESHEDGRTFLRSLRAIGAATPSDSGRVRSAGTLRRAVRAFEAQGSVVTYAVATCLIRRNRSRDRAPPDG